MNGKSSISSRDGLVARSAELTTKPGFCRKVERGFLKLFLQTSFARRGIDGVFGEGMSGWVGIIVTLASLLTLADFNVAAAQALTKVRVANIGGTSDHIQVGINAGVYRKHGFDIENIQVGSSATVVQSLLAGEVSFAHVACQSWRPPLAELI